jgi:hypothetical protein
MLLPAMMAVAAGFLSWSSEPWYCNKSTTSAEIFATRLGGAFAALLEKEIFENEPPLLRL